MYPRIFPLGFDFLHPFLEPYACFTSNPADADMVLAGGNTRDGFTAEMEQASAWGKPVAWWTLEDPNCFDSFLPQARLADIVLTTDEDCVPRYQEVLGHRRVHWLPLACSPQYHKPQPLAHDPADFVISANWYTNEARLWGFETVVEPLRMSGRSIALFCYENFMWPECYRPYWKGRGDYRGVAGQYRAGRVVLGLNNQRSGLDGRAHTVMTSMRTFEALACGKPFLAAGSDAYARLGLIHGEHLAAVETVEQTLDWAERLLGPEGRRIAEAGRRYVLDHHTYEHRLAAIAAFMREHHATNGAGGTRQQREAPMGINEETDAMKQRLTSLAISRQRLAGLEALAAEHNNGNMRSAELLLLAEAMQSFPWEKDQIVCEIGTFHGVTAAFLGRLSDRWKLPCAIVSVDSFESPYLAHLPYPSAEYHRTMSGYGLFPRRNCPIQMRSEAALTFVPDRIGLLLVDGGHDYATCLSDLESYSRKLLPGGFLAVDDVWYETVRRATDVFKAAHPEFEWIASLEKIELLRKRA